MKKTELIFIVFLCSLLSCRTKQISESAYDIISIKMNRYEIIDSLAVDSMVKKAQQIHKNYTGYVAHNLEFGQLRESKDFYIKSNSSFCSDINFVFEPTIYQNNGKVTCLGYSYYNGMILLVSTWNFPSLLFRKTDEWDYVVFFSGECNDWGSRCMFNSSYNFIGSENFAETSKVFSQDYIPARKCRRKAK